MIAILFATLRGTKLLVAPKSWFPRTQKMKEPKKKRSMFKINENITYITKEPKNIQLSLQGARGLSKGYRIHKGSQHRCCDLATACSHRRRL